MATVRICRKISYVAGVALAFAMSHGQARAQTPGCTAMEVAVEDQDAFTQRPPPLLINWAKRTSQEGLGNRRPPLH